MHYVIMTVILAAFWVMATETSTLANWLLGSVVGLGCILAGRENPRLFHGMPNPLAGLRLLFAVVWGVIRANVEVAWLSVWPEVRLRPAIVAVPLDLRGEFPVMLFSNLISLTPGTLAVAVDNQRHILYVHSLDVEDEVETVADLKRSFERPIKRFLEK